MLLNAKARLLATESTPVALTAAPLTPGSVFKFLESIGANPEEFDTPRLDGKNLWQVPMNGDLEDLSSLLTKAAGKPILTENDTEYSTAVWNLKGKGVIAIDFANGDLYLANVTGPSALGLVFNMLSNELRYKSLDIDPKTKTIEYQPYENSGRSAVKGIIKKLLKGLGLTGWTFTLPRGHWG